MNATPVSLGVVVGVDDAEHSGHAADWAAREAAERGTALTVVHALDDVPGGSNAWVARRRESGAALLGRAVGRLANHYPDLRINSVLDERSAVRALAGLSLDAELVVTGTRGHGAVVGALLRSVSTGLTRVAHCPVVVVRGEQPAVTKLELVLGLQTDEDPGPIDFAFRTAEQLGLTVRGVRASQPAGSDDGAYVDDVEAGRGDAMIGMVSLLRQHRFQHPDVPVVLEAHCDAPGPALNKAARDARLLVVGAQTRHVGRTVHELLSLPGSPLAVVPYVPYD